MSDMLNLIGRKQPLFKSDLEKNHNFLLDEVRKSRFLVIGAAGSIGQAVTKEIFLRNPKVLHAVDISENNMVELVRDLRSSVGYIDGDFRTFALDCGSKEFEYFYEQEGPYDYILNLSALKHVRSEKDKYTLMRMVEVNILNTIKTLDMAIKSGAKKYFCVSTDKAANPVNMMGASKRIMEMFLFEKSKDIDISTARFANVAFSDGSLLYGFEKRISKNQPLSAPKDVKRYFVTAQEAGFLCLASTILGENKEIFFPKLSSELNLTTFDEIAKKYLRSIGYEPHICKSEEEARAKVLDLKKKREWPCYFFDSDTTGEKDFEEFFVEKEEVNFDKFCGIGVVKNSPNYNSEDLKFFLKQIEKMRSDMRWEREEIIDFFNKIIPNFNHKETGKFLDGRM